MFSIFPTIGCPPRSFEEFANLSGSAVAVAVVHHVATENGTERWSGPAVLQDMEQTAAAAPRAKPGPEDLHAPPALSAASAPVAVVTVERC